MACFNFDFPVINATTTSNANGTFIQPYITIIMLMHCFLDVNLCRRQSATVIKQNSSVLILILIRVTMMTLAFKVLVQLLNKSFPLRIMDSKENPFKIYRYLKKTFSITTLKFQACAAKLYRTHTHSLGGLNKIWIRNTRLSWLTTEFHVTRVCVLLKWMKLKTGQNESTHFYAKTFRRTCIRFSN